ncbi:retrovirus-related Pol polyprotein from type-1 retrotransposable element R1 [Trichonephila clavipes]|nr:retrovirus-related Pol polyprotein from type-1 retrotransposable element R1 [Trichonephila clavipes]
MIVYDVEDELESNPDYVKKDDIDDKVAQHKWLLKESPFNHDQQNFSFTRFSSVKTIRLPDGTLEEHRSVTDNHGNTITTVHRAIGDQSHEVATQVDEKGLKEKLERFTNMDERKKRMSISECPVPESILPVSPSALGERPHSLGVKFHP